MKRREESERALPGAATLSPEHIELIRLLVTDLPASAIASRLGVTDRTVRRRVQRLCDHLGVNSRVEVIIWAVRHGVV